MASNGFRDVRVKVMGVTTHAAVSTDAAPSRSAKVVLVHGLGLSHRYMMPTAETLAARFQVYVPDLPGFGDSGHPEKILDIAGLADALAGFLEAMQLDHVSMLGNSQGCQIIIDFALRYPGRIDRGVLQGPTTPPDERSWIKQFIRWRQNACYSPPSINPITWGEYPKSGIWRVLKTFHYSLQDRPEEKLARIKTPMLVIRGTLDPICHEKWAEAVADGLPNGRLSLIPEVAHTLVYTSPKELAAAAGDFLAGSA